MALTNWILSISIILAATHSWALTIGGSGAGNGGDVILCSGVPSRPEIQLLDFYELELFENLKPLVVESTPGSAHDKAAAAIRTLQNVSPIRMERYLDELNHFMSRITFVRYELPNLPDDLNVVMPKGCSLQQIAIQQKPTGVPLYTVNENLWNRLDENQKAGLILHEIVYSENIYGGHSDARATRAFTKRLGVGIPKEWTNQRNRNTNSNFPYLLDTIGIHTYREQILYSGDVVVLAPFARLEGMYTYCGYKKVNGPTVILLDLCLTKTPALRIEDSYRVASVIDHQGQLLYRMPGAEVGLPSTYVSYETMDLSPVQSFVDSAPFVFSNAEANVTCLPGTPVSVVRLEKGDYTIFDFSKSRLLTCKLDPNQAPDNQIFLKGMWRSIVAFDLRASRYYDETGKARDYVQFKNLESFEHNNHQFMAKSYSLKAGSEYYDEVQPFQYVNQDFTCEVSGSLSTNPTVLNFGGKPCQIEINKIKFQFSTITLGLVRAPENFKYGTLAESIEIPGKDETQYLPSGTVIEWTGRPMETHKDLVTKYPSKVRLMDKAVVTISGAFRLNYDHLNWGTLAEDATVTMVDGASPTCKNTGKRKVKAGTKISFDCDCRAYRKLGG
ncbi:hypothetical protein [Bdellovibrio sp. HCB2-146]|uniref:hypothetical protein n=1 Tax=Bdellovibrio sp. HCB2-146 TaxID=3394362 RepID=UPI0039BD146E